MSQKIRNRATTVSILRPKLVWCLHCFRTSIKSFESAAGVPFEIECELDAKKSILCRQCSARNALCLSTAVGMLGNAADLSAIIEWYVGFWEVDEDGVEVWAGEVIPGINEAIRTLCLAFDNVEIAHRKAHGITGNKRDQSARKTEYELFCAARRRELAHVLPPARDASKDDWHFYRVQKLLRLLPGDDELSKPGATVQRIHAFGGAEKCIRRHFYQLSRYRQELLSNGCLSIASIMLQCIYPMLLSC
ncbi:predicted protein [Aspergillus nidulans FGSC A4]|uniref:Uncharacterized protein n=1 Tax=Emericella nidulans (strain FGSC A4 / ATCC 38163 / CBS 112.46 / NRRL 194 / M139) TaxID=227321 RepID=Q5BEJ0_EMENI|nr:hypothetical protein [Aspergillus nidulans FGSC A4]EAA65608.1 predicted protein [Aspergillus nidulans FGSC A4]CBF88280.1 TPA: conserved hypothetical protein [Aspergillus nidulans FGSC A4]|eukprot:XP_658644.1 predicted protein [Aspergillus nidulans FGSC A4]